VNFTRNETKTKREVIVMSDHKRTLLVVGNLKMNPESSEEVTRLARGIVLGHGSREGVKVVLCPPAIWLPVVGDVLERVSVPIGLGAQDVYWADSGAYTGAISPVMLEAVGCGYCIVGHSERREHFGETDQTVNEKVRALLGLGITPIICVGEGLEVRDAGAREAIAYVTAQLHGALEFISSQWLNAIVIAYEPIWAIGTGRTATPEVAQEMCASIREHLAKRVSVAFANETRILYGGSVKPENAAQLAAMHDIDGGLIGGASLDAQSFISIVKAFAREE
jgi:triosephosphate isomerase